MTSTDIVNNLQDYISLLSAIERDEQLYLKVNGEPAVLFSKSVSLSYETITLMLSRITDHEGEPDTHPYMISTFEIGQKHVSLKDVYCERKERESVITDYTLLHKSDVFKAGNKKGTYSQEVYHYLDIANAIASQAYLCSSGDNYRPGYFTEISITQDFIVLRQINRHNSRSIDHKDDYYMRDLEFSIPLIPSTSKRSYQDEQIGDMIVRFNDSSSLPNRTCGDLIRQKIDEEKKKFQP